MELSCFFHDPADVCNLIPGSSAFSKTSMNIWKFTVQVLLKPGLENFEHFFTSVWDDCNCAVVLAFFVIAFLGDWNDNWCFPVLWPLLSFPNLLACWMHAAPHGLWNLSSSTRDWTQATAVKVLSYLATEPLSENFLNFCFYLSFSFFCLSLPLLFPPFMPSLLLLNWLVFIWVVGGKRYIFKKDLKW